MNDIIWINGKIIPFNEARIDVEDRGYQFADGVYEVFRLYDGKVFAMNEHLIRLERSCKGILIDLPLDRMALAGEIRKLVEKSGVGEGMVYLQITRGVSPRNHVCGKLKPVMLFYARPLPKVAEPGTGEGAKVMSVADERWKRCWIKSIALLPNILAKNQAVAAGYDEAVFIDNDIITECSASNIFAIFGNKLVTHPVGSKVLPGVTRDALLELAPSVGLEPDERGMHQDEILRADEAFITSTTREITWLARFNDRYIGLGKCGPKTKRLHEALQKRVMESLVASH